VRLRKGLGVAGVGQSAAALADLVLGLVVDIGVAVPDQQFGPVVQPLEIVRGVEHVLAPVEAEPVHVGLDRVDILLLFLGRVGVVEPQMAAAAELLGDAEIQRDRLGMADMQIAVRLRREPGHDGAVPAAVEIGLHDVANEIAPCLARRCLCRRHA